ncbi:CheR methyltransferase SAM binding domain-containing protein [Campylobacter sputorum subsp. bubulus]|uniref:CheR methyltransferase SAM binding domain-containing protein n=1 Tax=Campylobacter sputorum subsp. sputorum TaxID=32024 RepID=A0A381DKY9_9BACT|nr:CheR family methyltransferase [Campylobacter sputorum]ASM34672.1 MCP protein methyltransferase [Campylobacter sputorum aubsp. sputorum RM3237]KAB0581766.1 protein-glutamate O-methyltransferase CheR [Campylobacter sputorum subsp. sputorum]QEL04863.1 MCP protein methyltransferase [Campylobacter sputorum subsp. sputorum]SUX09893.1 CheR methyltransferase SAM binding domain-containing protein [Campylobacter sputorum subsp. bubulus]SUX11349.1 CheR methyltransferase SAM binding domain-containing p
MFFRRKKKEESNLQETNKKDLIIDTRNFDKFISIIQDICGADLKPKYNTIFERLEIFAKNRQIPSFDKIIDLMKTDSNLKQDILNLITVNETYFYRELPQLKEVINYAKTLNNPKILCAPCSSGDEVYSLCMLAVENNLRNVSLLGIDINSEAINECIEGRYNERHLHRLNSEQKNKFFINKNGMFEIKKNILPKYEFKIVNIFDDEMLKIGTFDIILSRNMMIYFDDEFKLKCVKILHKLLNQNGRLYAGHADLIPDTEIYQKVYESGVSYYKKI